MKYRSAMLAGLAAMIAVAAPATANAAPWQSINARQANLDARINQGVRSGALTRNEAQRLRGALRDLNRREAMYRRSGGGLSVQERNDLNRRFDRLSAQVRVDKHDRRRRG